MADTASDSEDSPAPRSQPKRRRILDPSAFIPIPVYSSRVNRTLQLKPSTVTQHRSKTADEQADSSLPESPVSCPPVVVLLDSDSEGEQTQSKGSARRRDTLRSPSPPPDSPVLKQSKAVTRKISEVNRTLRAVTSLSPQRSSRPRRPQPEDVVVIDPDLVQDSPLDSSDREIPLKIRCRTDIHKVLVQKSTPLSWVMSKLSSRLSVPVRRLLLLREELDLPLDATVGELGLGITDIIECHIMGEEQGGGASSCNDITVRLQSKDSSQEFSLNRDAPLGSIFSQFLSSLSAHARRAASFHFDGTKVTWSQTPAEIDMDDGDLIEVWL